MKRYTQLETEVLKAAGYSVKEIARLDAAPHSRCDVMTLEDAEEYDLAGENVEYNGKQYVVVWLG